MKKIDQIINELEKKLKAHNTLKHSNIVCSYIHNSKLTASGDILLMKQGGYTSTLNAGQNIITINKRAFLKSGEYQARHWLIAGQLGAPMGKTKIKVGRGILINNVKGRITIISNYDRRTLEQIQKSFYESKQVWKIRIKILAWMV